MDDEAAAARFAQFDRRLDRTAELMLQITQGLAEMVDRQAKNTDDIAQLTEDIKRLFDGMSEHLRGHPGTET